MSLTSAHAPHDFPPSRCSLLRWFSGACRFREWPRTGQPPRWASRLTRAIDERQQVTLKGSVHGLATAANDRGMVDDGVQLDRIEVMLKRSPAQETALQQLLQDMHTPGTASYHKWLTPTQFGEQFGPSDCGYCDHHSVAGQPRLSR